MVWQNVYCKLHCPLFDQQLDLERRDLAGLKVLQAVIVREQMTTSVG